MVEGEGGWRCWGWQTRGSLTAGLAKQKLSLSTKKTVKTKQMKRQVLTNLEHRVTQQVTLQVNRQAGRVFIMQVLISEMSFRCADGLLAGEAGQVTPTYIHNTETNEAD